LAPLVAALGDLDLSEFDYVSFHAPSKLAEGSEQDVLRLLRVVVQKGWGVIVHPEIITDFRSWAEFDDQLLIENMDKRKAIGRTAIELEYVFARLPRATFCFDIGHAHQVDPTMTEASMMLIRFEPRIRQLHVSEVNTQSKHDPLSVGTLLAFKKVWSLVPDGTPIILESRVAEDMVENEIDVTQSLFSGHRTSECVAD